MNTAEGFAGKGVYQICIESVVHDGLAQVFRENLTRHRAIFPVLEIDTRVELIICWFNVFVNMFYVTRNKVIVRVIYEINSR